jgi:mono/diheme cytochrome c family protein
MRRRMPSLRNIATLTAAAALALGASACGSEEIKISKSDQGTDVEHGAQLFKERCSGCHTVREAAARGSKPTGQKPGGERTNGPNFNVRKEQYDDVLLAIRNGGFSGAIMPANIVVGKDAEDVAKFVSKYAGGGSDDTTNNGSENQSATP